MDAEKLDEYLDSLDLEDLMNLRGLVDHRIKYYKVLNGTVKVPNEDLFGSGFECLSRQQREEFRAIAKEGDAFGMAAYLAEAAEERGIFRILIGSPNEHMVLLGRYLKSMGFLPVLDLRCKGAHDSFVDYDDIIH